MVVHHLRDKDVEGSKVLGDKVAPSTLPNESVSSDRRLTRISVAATINPNLLPCDHIDHMGQQWQEVRWFKLNDPIRMDLNLKED